MDCPLLRQPENTAAVVFDGMGEAEKAFSGCLN